MKNEKNSQKKDSLIRRRIIALAMAGTISCGALATYLSNTDAMTGWKKKQSEIDNYLADYMTTEEFKTAYDEKFQELNTSLINREITGEVYDEKFGYLNSSQFAKYVALENNDKKIDALLQEYERAVAKSNKMNIPFALSLAGIIGFPYLSFGLYQFNQLKNKENVSKKTGDNVDEEHSV